MPIYFSAKAISELRGYPKMQRRTFIARAIAENAWNPFVWLSCGLAFPCLFAALAAAAIFIPVAEIVAFWLADRYWDWRTFGNRNCGLYAD